MSELIRFTAIVQRKDSKEFRNAGQFNHPVLPCIGEHLVIAEATPDGSDRMDIAYKVTGLFHALPFRGLTEVFAVYDGHVFDAQKSFLR